MALRNICVDGDDVLRKRAKEVDVVNDKIRMIVDDLKETMHENNGIGLAAPQVGILKRIFVIETEDQEIEMINPRILDISGEQTGEEGCLSVPGRIGTVKRPTYIRMEGLDRQGNPIEVEGVGLLAVVLSHEFDHLEGILFTERASDIIDTDASKEE